MSVVVRASVSASARNGVGVALSAESQVGDLAVLLMSSQFATTAAAPPEGWTVIRSEDVNRRSGYVAHLKVSDPAQTRDVVWYTQTEGDNARQNGVLLVLSGVGGVDTEGWVLAPAGPVPDRTMVYASQQHDTASAPLDAWAADDVLVPGEASTEGSWSAIRVGVSRTVPSGGSSSRAWVALAVSSAAGGQPPAGSGFALWDGQAEKEVSLSVWDGHGEGPVAGAGVMPWGARSVDELLSTPRFVVAHRGGSTAWFEHTQCAYTSAVAYGCQALEISAARTSDGVWFGCHDKTLARLGGGDVDPSTMTWAQVQAALPSDRVPATLDWLLGTYGGSHVIVFDPKYRAGDGLDEYTGLLGWYKDRVLLKFYGDSAWLFRAWKERGFRTWAYAYASNVGEAWYASLLASQDVDVLSMEWGAPEEVWQGLTGTGKKVVSHIPGSAQEVEAGWARGASGTICSNPPAVLPLRV